jgi:hypothetical protein
LFCRTADQLHQRTLIFIICPKQSLATLGTAIVLVSCCLYLCKLFSLILISNDEIEIERVCCCFKSGCLFFCQNKTIWVHFFFFFFLLSFFLGVALCPNDNTVEIWAWNGSAWSKEHTLTEVCLLETCRLAASRAFLFFYRVPDYFFFSKIMIHKIVSTHT